MRPIDGQTPAQLVLQRGDARHSIDLAANRPITITPDTTTKHCTGWYDIETHTGHTCPDSAIVDTRHQQCYACRQRTDFNPAFYNTTDISAKQAAYNNSPHSVYVAYFGGSLAKAGISADSRGLRRLREQGALLYAVIDSFPSADVAHYHEDQLIATGLRNSVNKRQKAKVFESPINQQHETTVFQSLLDERDIGQHVIIDQLDDFYYGAYNDQPVTPIDNHPISGTVQAIVGRYLVLDNNDRLYGIWLDTLLGYHLTIDDDITSIAAPPQQASLF